jgi:hypothetical protein
MAVSESRGVRHRITPNSRHLEDDECGWDASGIHTTLSETVRKGRASMRGLGLLATIACL